CGYRAEGGARAVGFATRTTVVAACLTILLSDYILTSFLPFGFARLKVT
ncbi:MAG: ABC transporter permease, partial [Deltaproteobacteria bacterium]|nr:ABC transporter permease [Deltaproteobacteria bacterium]